MTEPSRSRPAGWIAAAVPEHGPAGRLLAHVSDPLFRHAYTLIVNTGLTSALGIVYWVVVARLFDSAEVGVNAAIISAIVLLAGLAQLNLRPMLGRFMPVAGTRSVRLATTSYAAATVVAVLVAVVFLAGSSIWAGSGPIPAVRDDLALGLLFVTCTVVWTVFALQDGLLVGLRATAWLTLENVTFGVAKLAVVALLAVTGVGGGYAITASWLLPMVVAVGLVNVLLFARLIPRHMRRDPTPDRLVTPRRIVRFAAGDYVGSLFALSYVSLLPVIVIDQLGAVGGAQFYIVWVVAGSLQLIPPQMISSLTVDTAANPDTFRRQGRRMLVAMFRILLPMCALAILTAPLILAVFGSGYQDATTLMRLLVLAIIPYSLNTLYLALARNTVRPRRIMVVQGALGILIVGATVLLIGPLGLEGVGLAYLFGQSTVACVLLATALRPIVAGHHPSTAAPSH